MAVPWRGSVTLKDATRGKGRCVPKPGYMGLPLLTTLVGPAAAGTIISTIVVDIVLTSSVCIALAQWQEASRHGHRAAIVTALRGVALNPLPSAIALATAISATDLKPDDPIKPIFACLLMQQRPWRSSQSEPCRAFQQICKYSTPFPSSRSRYSNWAPDAGSLCRKGGPALGAGISDLEVMGLTLTARCQVQATSGHSPSVTVRTMRASPGLS